MHVGLSEANRNTGMEHPAAIDRNANNFERAAQHF
jgi:hypothetical protein